MSTAQYYQKTLKILLDDYRSGLVTIPGLIVEYIRIKFAPGSRVNLSPNKVCAELGIKLGSFYRASAQIIKKKLITRAIHIVREDKILNEEYVGHEKSSDDTENVNTSIGYAEETSAPLSVIHENENPIHEDENPIHKSVKEIHKEQKNIHIDEKELYISPLGGSAITESTLSFRWRRCFKALHASCRKEDIVKHSSWRRPIGMEKKLSISLSRSKKG